jgi:uncharacterized membrane protein
MAGAMVSAYAGFAVVRFGFDAWPLGAGIVIMLVTGAVVWTRSAAGMIGPGELGPSLLLGARALPLLVAWPVAVLYPEFVFGTPSKDRAAAVLLMVVALFGLLALVTRERARGAVAWVEARSGAIAVGIVFVHAVAFGGAVLLRHVTFGAEHGDDTAYYTQILWSTIQGEFFRGSVTQDRYFDPPVATEFALHNSPVLLAVLPLYALLPSFYTLLLLRTVLLSAGAIPLFLLAKEKIGGAAGLVILVVYFSSANIVHQALNGFYPLHLIACFLPFAFLYFFRERFWPFCLWLLMALTVREEIALTAALFGVYALLLRRSLRWVLVPLVVSAAWWYVSTEFVMVRSRIAMEELDAFYRAFGAGHNSALATILEHPEIVLGPVLTQDNLRYLYDLAKPTAFFPLLSPSVLLALPSLIVNSVIGAFMATMRNVSYHYSLVAFICVFVAMIDGIGRLARYSQGFGVTPPVFGVCLGLLLLPSSVLGAMDVVRYGSGQAPLLLDFLPKPHRSTLERSLALIPPEASVAAPQSLMPYLAHRRGLYNSDRLWRYGERPVDYVILDVRLDRLSEVDRNRPRYEAVVATIRGDGNYDLLLAEAGFEVYQRRMKQGRHAAGGVTRPRPSELLP